MKLFVLFLFLYFVAAFFVSRGSDGRLIAAWALLPTIGIAYLSVNFYVTKSILNWKMVSYFIVFEIVAFGGMLVNNQLDGMGGMLYLIVPIAIAVGFVCGVLLVLLLSKAL